MDIRRIIRNLPRSEIVEHLEQAGFACYDHESTEELEEALILACECGDVEIVDIA